MKAPLLLSLLAVGLSAAALVVVLKGAGAGPGDSAPAELPVLAAPDPELAARVDELTRENRRLRDRLALLEARPSSGTEPRRPVNEAEYVPLERFEAFEEEVRAALGRRGTAESSPGPAGSGFKEQVARTLDEIQREKGAADLRAKQLKRREGLDARMAKLDGWLGLTRDQSEQMRSALLSHFDREEEVLMRWEAGESPEVLGRLKDDHYSAFRDELSRFLTPGQVETYLGNGGGK